MKNQGEQTGRWVTSWVSEVQGAHWKRPSDVASQFPKARLEADGVFLFPVAHCSFAIQVLIAFPQGVALITALKVIEIANGR